MNSKELKLIMQRQHVTVSDIAGTLNMTSAGARKKIDGRTAWSVKQMDAIAESMHMSNDEILNVFFTAQD